VRVMSAMDAMNALEWEKDGIYSIDATKPGAAVAVRDALVLCLASENTRRELVFVCIGTDRATGDSLGPLTGHKLAERVQKKVAIYGTLEVPVHARNLRESMDMIQNRHKNPLVIAVDACLGLYARVGWLTVARRPIWPGAALRKGLPCVGDISVMGTVSGGVAAEMSALQNTRLYTVMKMADAIADGIAEVLEMQKDGGA